jgi:hypothetical protein
MRAARNAAIVAGIGLVAFVIYGLSSDYSWEEYGPETETIAGWRRSAETHCREIGRPAIYVLETDIRRSAEAFCKSNPYPSKTFDQCVAADLRAARETQAFARSSDPCVSAHMHFLKRQADIRNQEGTSGEPGHPRREGSDVRFR